MRRARTLLAHIRTEESGVTLIEVLVSAVLLATVSVGVLTGLDAASATSGAGKARAVAAVLAQQDQERLRSFRAKELSNARETRTQTVRRMRYTIVSKASWVTDASGAQSCSGSGDQANYLRISSTVTWTGMRGVKPVTQVSLVAPPNGSFGDEGSLAVEVLDRTGAGVSGVDVDLTGPRASGGTTDLAGCAFFGYLPAGNYQIAFSRSGYVDAQGVTAVTKQASVVDEATSRVSFLYERAGALDVTFETKKDAQIVPADTEQLSVANSGLAAPGTRVFETGGPVASLTAEPLFPFTSAYSVYSGNCTGANPLTYAQTPPLVTLTPGGRQQVTVREPAVKVTSGGGLLPADTRVTLTARAIGCGGVSSFKTDPDGWLVPDPPTGPNDDPGVPFGIYDVCAERSGRKLQRNGQLVTDPNGVTADVPLPGGGPAGSCP